MCGIEAKTKKAREFGPFMDTQSNSSSNIPFDQPNSVTASEQLLIKPDEEINKDGAVNSSAEFDQSEQAEKAKDEMQSEANDLMSNSNEGT